MVGEKLFQTNLLSRLSHKVCRLLSSPVLLRKFTNVFRTKVLIGETTFTSPALLDTGPPFYVVIWATRGSSHLQGKGSTFISQFFFKDPEPVPVRPRESNPRPRALQSSALPTDLILRSSMAYSYLFWTISETKLVFCKMAHLTKGSWLTCRS